ncbi:uncharacterized protein [Drosophila pseudoobscura]|uniref:Uncharacterized protein n=1 Tax=Drosophila pseudoobscura pseudoobscura TaxID=46245 RepID=A0A6I8UPL6_DROPS|nr:uncharacterized protein LOC4801810 [Drosophila pseudoobscura]
MRCKLLVMVFVVSVILQSFRASVSSEAIKKCDNRHKPGNCKPCKINHKSSSIAPKAATEAKSAKDAQPSAGEKVGNRAKTQMADKAMAAAKAAETVLAGKKQLVQALQNSLGDIKQVIKEIKKATARSSSVATMVRRIHNTDKKNYAMLKCLYEEVQANLVKIGTVAENAQREAMEKRKLLQTAKHRVQYLKKRMKEVLADLEATRASAKKANCAAKQAQQRINTMEEAGDRLRTLKRRDLQSLRRKGGMLELGKFPL